MRDGGWAKIRQHSGPRFSSKATSTARSGGASPRGGVPPWPEPRPRPEPAPAGTGRHQENRRYRVENRATRAKDAVGSGGDHHAQEPEGRRPDPRRPRRALRPARGNAGRRVGCGELETGGRRHPDAHPRAGGRAPGALRSLGTLGPGEPAQARRPTGTTTGNLAPASTVGRAWAGRAGERAAPSPHPGRPGRATVLTPVKVRCSQSSPCSPPSGGCARVRAAPLLA